MDITFGVRGLRELDRELDKLSARGAKNAKRAALRKGAQHLRREIKPQLPRTVGGGREHLRNRIGIKVHRNGDVDIGYRGVARMYGHLIEFGESYGKALTSSGVGVWERTLAAEAERVIDITGTALGEAIIKEIQRGR
jgi:HK97 gp10 family phage protein